MLCCDVLCLCALVFALLRVCVLFDLVWLGLFLGVYFDFDTRATSKLDLGNFDPGSPLRVVPQCLVTRSGRSAQPQRMCANGQSSEFFFGSGRRTPII